MYRVQRLQERKLRVIKDFKGYKPLESFCYFIEVGSLKRAAAGKLCELSAGFGVKLR